MSIQAFRPLEQRDNESTAKLQLSEHGPIIDALPLLDYRTRRRTISTKLAPRGHYLEFQADGEARYLPLDQKITHIGRGFSADLRIEQAQVSVSHAILVRHGRFMRVLDDRSSNGTFVNGRQIITTNLNHGDVLRIGPVVMRYVVVS